MKIPRYVYFIKPVGLDGPIKIGSSDVPLRRLEDLMVWSPFPLELIGKTPGSTTDEFFLHTCFSDSHFHHEWFHFTPALRHAIDKMLASSINDVRGSLTPKGAIRKPRGPKPPKTESQKLEEQYAARIIAAEKSVKNIVRGTGPTLQPYDVRKIMTAWHGNTCRRIEPIHPTSAEIARLEEYLSNPKVHSVVSHWNRPKESICIPVFPTGETLQ